MVIYQILHPWEDHWLTLDTGLVVHLPTSNHDDSDPFQRADGKSPLDNSSVYQYCESYFRVSQ